MGSPVSVVVAEIVMQNIEEQALATYSEALPLWLRYVDDTITAVHESKIDEFHEHLNEQNTNIQFTKEIEENGKIPFLDCLVTRENNTLRTIVYRKPTHTDRLLDQTSYNPTSHKATVTTVRTLTRRALKNKPRYRLGLCYVFNLRYRLLSTNYTRKLVYQLRTNCPQSLSTSSRTLQTFTQQETITPCLLFILQPIYLHNLSPHMSSQPITSRTYQRLIYLLTNQIVHQGFWIFNWLTLPLDPEDGFRTGCRNVSH